MAMTVHLDIVSVEAAIFSGLVEMVVADGVMGELGIFPGHTPLLTSLKSGVIRAVLQGGREEVIYVSGGILEIQPALITVLANTATRAADLDEAEAAAAKERAEKILHDKTVEFEYSKAMTQLAEASAQLRAIRRIRKQAGK
ncbi:MAG: F0F1 ATP synthase subunit epsilon [Gammaproteobacteria bacterium]